MRKEKITILCSGVTLGVYIPGLIINYQLSKKGLSTDVVILENLIFPEKRKKILDMKIAYHQNFKVALMGQKLAKNNNNYNIDASLVFDLLATWKQEKRKRFIVFSGFWVTILEQYLQEVDFQNILIDLCHMDSDISSSWKSYNVIHSSFRHIWFFNWESKSISYCLHRSKNKPISYNKRAERFVIHGGGWGIGTYKEKIPQLQKRGIKLDIIAYEESDIEYINENNRYFMIEPLWKSWEKNEEGYYQFPPFAEVKNNEKIYYKNNKEFSELHHLIQQSKAIISKPGGGTLIDSSLSSATPVILLEPYGAHENKNALLWEYLGFGIPYQKWVDFGCSVKVLEKLHKNLLKVREKIQDYTEELYYAAANRSSV